MKHLDEGIIHAWLDGELTAAEAGATEAHVNSCAECSAKVAEARGFIAGASRILTSLDDVPAVAPKRAPSTAPAVRQWRAAPWVTGIAAALVLAVGVTTWQRDGTTPEAAFKAGSIRTSVVFDSTLGAAMEQRQIATNRAPVPMPTAQGVSGPPRGDAALAERARSARAARAEAPRTAGGAGAPAQDLASGAAGGRAAAPAGAAADRAEPAAAADSGQLKKTLAREVVVAGSGAGIERAKVPFRVTPDSFSVAKFTSARDLAGCYPITVPPVALPVAVAEASAPAAKSTGARRPAQTTAPVVAPAPTAAMNRASDEAGLPPLPPTVLLDTTSTVRGLLVRSPATRVALGFWERVGSDSVRVNLLFHGVHTIAANKRTSCP